MNISKLKYNKEQLEEAVKKSYSFMSCAINLGFKPKNKNDLLNESKKIKRYILRFGISTSHFTGQSWNKGKIYKNSSEKIKDYESGKLKISSNAYKNFLFKYEIKKPTCEICGNSEWNNLPIPTQLHHRDGHSENNKLENLQILCPNCHAQTDNYCKSKSTNNRVSEDTLLTNIPLSKSITEVLRKSNLSYGYANHLRVKRIIDSGKASLIAKKTVQEYVPSPELIAKPKLQRYKVPHPAKEDLEKLILQKPMTSIAKDFGVSDQAVKKWAKRYDIIIPPMRGYWAKKKYGKI